MASKATWCTEDVNFFSEATIFLYFFWGAKISLLFYCFSSVIIFICRITIHMHQCRVILSSFTNIAQNLLNFFYNIYHLTAHLVGYHAMWQPHLRGGVVLRPCWRGCHISQEVQSAQHSQQGCKTIKHM